MRIPILFILILWIHQTTGIRRPGNKHKTRIYMTTTITTISKGSNDRDQQKEHFTQNLYFIIPVTLAALAFILTFTYCWLCKQGYCVCACCPIYGEKHRAKQSKWSIMLGKRPLPKLPPEAKRDRQTDETDSVSSKTDDTAKYGTYYSYPNLNMRNENKHYDNPYDDLNGEKDIEGAYEELKQIQYQETMEPPDGVYMEYKPKT